MLMASANLQQVRKLRQAVADNDIDLKKVALFIDEVHSMFEISEEEKKALSKELKELIWTKNPESGKKELAVGRLVMFTATDADISQLFQNMDVKKEDYIRITADPQRLKEMGYFGLGNLRVFSLPDSLFRLSHLNRDNRFGRDHTRRMASMKCDKEFLRNMTLDDFTPEVRMWAHV
jgi:hypothetical protein